MKASEALKIADDYNRLSDIDKEIIKIYGLIEESAKAGNYWPTYSLNKPNLYEAILEQLLIDGYVVINDDYIREKIKENRYSVSIWMWISFYPEDIKQFKKNNSN